MRLYLNERPRTFIITSSTHALIIRHPFPTYKYGNTHLSHHITNVSTEKGSNLRSSTFFSNKAVVEFVKKDLLNLSKFKDITPSMSRSNKQILGFLGLLNVKSNIYLGFITNEVTVASPIIGEKVNKITGVDFYCLNNDEFDHLMNKSVDDDQTYQPHEKDKLTWEYPAASVRKLLSSGSFFYSKDFDITSNIQERCVQNKQEPLFFLIADSPYFKKFMWNSFMNSELIEFRNRLSPQERLPFDRAGFLTTITRGFAQTVNTTIQSNEDALLTLISKQSCLKKGPLFGDWGCDDNGAVSNFAETEIIVYTKRFCFAYTIVRGNVPIFWQLESHFSKKNILSSRNNKMVVFPRSFEASQHAFTRHFDMLVNQFGEVHILNALSQDLKTYKGKLNKNFKEHIEYFNNSKNLNDASTNASSGALNYTLSSTDLSISTATLKKIGYSVYNPYDVVPLLVDSIIDYGALFYDITKKNYIGKQLGVFRVNSFDSLNKANFISKIISQEVIELAFKDIGIQVDHDLLVKHAKLWAENGEYLSKITLNFVASSTKLQASSATSTKSSVKSHFTKKYLSGVVDTKPNETAMLKLLGRLQDQVSITLHNPIHDYVRRELNKRSKEFSSFKDISVFATTFNVNGSIYEESIEEWIFPSKYNISKSYDLVFVGFQEIVELSAGQMVNTESVNRIFWEKKIKETLDEHNPERFKYLSLWSGQIGGIALLLFIKESEIQNISNIEGSFKKTGLGGMSANKGGVAVSFTYSNTEICFVSSHLAAGLSNIDERHHDYKTIAKGIKFSRNRRIKDHDAVIWLGDFNYRIALPNEQVKPLIEQTRFMKLFEYDQLNRQMANGESFPFYDEMEIKFPPTYKFDNGTKTYDTSEKQRIPAWTDRILNLSRNKIIKQFLYDCAEEITFSDHRPVFANFNISVNIINDVIKKNLSMELQDTCKKNIGDINDIFFTNNDLSFLIKNIDNKILPPPSSEINKWWLEGGKPVKINIPELNNENTNDGDINVINPKLPLNPFEITEEPEFIRKSDLLKLLSVK